MPTASPRLRGLVLAGGASERMRRDKATLMVGVDTFLERAYRLVSAFTVDAFVSVRAPPNVDDIRARFPYLVDRHVDIGPAAGLLAAHAHDPAAAWLICACDMPDLDRRELSRLVEARDPARAATAFRNPETGAPEPLCAIYEPATLARLAADVDDRRSVSPRALLAGAGPVLIDPLRPEALRSVNTPDDLAQCERKL